MGPHKISESFNTKFLGFHRSDLTATVIFNETFNRLSPDYKSEILFASLKRITCFTTGRKNDLQGACVPFQWKYLHESTSTVANEISSSRWTSKRATCIFLSQFSL